MESSGFGPWGRELLVTGQTTRRLSACLLTLRRLVSYRDKVLSMTPKLYWRLNDVSGTTIADSSGNGNTGTITGTVTYSETGQVPDSDAAAISLDGVTAYFTANAYQPFTVDSQRTFAFLVKRDADQSQIINFFGGGGERSGVPGSLTFPVFETSGSPDHRFRWYGDISQQFPSYDDWDYNVPIGTWLHVVLTADMTANDVSGLKLWVNGTSIGSPTISPISSMLWKEWPSGAGRLMMGNRFKGDGTPEVEFADTTNQEFAIFERILSDTEIQDLARSSRPLP